LKRGTNKLCVGSSSVYGSDTWPTKVEHKVELDRTRCQILSWSDL